MYRQACRRLLPPRCGHPLKLRRSFAEASGKATGKPGGGGGSGGTGSEATAAASTAAKAVKSQKRTKRLGAAVGVLAACNIWMFWANDHVEMLQTPKFQTAIFQSQLPQPADSEDTALLKRPGLFNRLRPKGLKRIDGKPEKITLLYGPRGSGKTTALRCCMAGQHGVMPVQLTPPTAGGDPQEVWEQWCKDCFEGLPRKPLMIGNLTAARVFADTMLYFEKGSWIPHAVLIFELNEEFTASHLEYLFNKLNEHRAHARFFVVLSSSLSALGETLDYNQLGAEAVNIDALQEATAINFLSDVLKKRLSLEEAEVRTLSEYTVNRVGCLLSDVQGGLAAMSGTDSLEKLEETGQEHTLEGMKGLLDGYAESRVEEATQQLQLLMTAVPDTEAKAVRACLQHVALASGQAKEVRLSAVAKKVGLSDAECRALLRKRTALPLDYDPVKDTLKVASPFARAAIEIDKQNQRKQRK